MKFRGGYNILLGGKPDRSIETPAEPEVLYLPLHSRRFEFTELVVKDGQSIDGGDVLAYDPENFSVPLLAPRAGIVRLNTAKGHIVLENISETEFAYAEQGLLPHIDQDMGEKEAKRHKLLSLGAWQYFSDAYTGDLPDPSGTPQAVIVSTVSLEPYLARGDVQLQERLVDFTRGLEHLQSLLEYQPMYLVMPDIKSDLATQVRQQIRGYAWAKLIEIPLKYPYDHPNILARQLQLDKSQDTVWFVRTEGVLAVDRALTLSKPSLSRIISIGGTGVETPVHVKVMSGYPIETIRSKYISSAQARMLAGGALTGVPAEAQMLGIDTECTGLTVVAEHTEREFLGFMRPGWDRSSYAACFLSSLQAKFSENYTTAMRGEGRPCVSCNFCEEVCPAGIMPYLLHKHLYADLIEEVQQDRIDLCVECGLCSYVCPSKIELRKQFIEAKDLIEKEAEEMRQEQLKQEKLRQEEQARSQASQEAEY
ncbi:MAG: 4Fe-4S dicluster domain-containing protein [Planctomycetota bacterium]|jgi:Na+-transporting NADH:ubiquinone oxidoreductase subunit A